jgi:hypothetical protein
VVAETAGERAQTKHRGAALAVEEGRRVVLYHFAREIVDWRGHVWRIAERPRALAIDKRRGSGLLRRMGYASPDRLRLELDLSSRQDRAHKMEPGDVLYDSASGTVLSIATVAWERRLCVIEALQLNNLRVGGGGQIEAAVDVTASEGYLWRCVANVMVGNHMLFGDFTAGATLVGKVHAGDGDAAGIAACLAPGD